MSMVKEKTKKKNFFFCKSIKFGTDTRDWTRNKKVNWISAMSAIPTKNCHLKPIGTLHVYCIWI